MRQRRETTVRWRLFAFGGTDREAAQLWLDRQNAAGWRLTGLYGGLLARFERDTRNVVRCCVRPWPRRREMREYYQCWADAGWERAAGSWGLEVFQSQPGRWPLEPEYDGNEDQVRLERQSWWSCLGAVLAVLLTLLWNGGLGWSGVLLHDLRLMGTAVLAGIDLLLAGYGISLVRKRRRAFRGGKTDPSRLLQAARLRYGCGCAVCVLFCGLLLLNGLQAARSEDGGPLTTGPLVTAEELGLESGSLYGREGASILAAWSRTQEFLREGDAPVGTVVCDVYRCANEPTARLLAALLRAEEARGRTQHLLERHGGLAWTAAELGLDQSWTAQDGARNCLLAVHGRTVVLLEAPEGAQFEAILARLQEIDGSYT